MKLKLTVLSSFALLISMVFCAGASAQQKEGPDLMQQAEDEADRLARVLDLEDWQVFYVDSTLKHDYPAMIADYEKLQTSKVTNTALYQSVQDKWMDQIDQTYKRIFTEQQWAAYLKSGAAKQIKAREKRKAKANQ